MCNFKELYADRRGYIIQCLNCNQFQLCFGTSLLSLDQHQYKIFFHSVLVKFQELPLLENDILLKYFVLPTVSLNVQCILTGEELQWLYEAMEAADTEMKTCQMIALFKQTK